MTTTTAPTSNAETVPPRWRDLWRTRAVRAVLLVELLVAAMVVYGLWALRSQALDGELRMLASLSAAMAAQADGSLALAASTLHATTLELANGLIVPGSPQARDILRRRMSGMPMFRALLVLDADGREVASSRDMPGPVVSLAGSDWFTASRADAGAELHVGRPQVSALDPREAIPLSTPWLGQAGEFKGLVVLVADPEFLDGAFARIAPTPDTGMALYRRDHQLVSNGPGDGTPRLLPHAVADALWDRALPESPTLVRPPGAPARLVAAHLLVRAPLMLVITRDARAVLAEWEDQALLVGSFVLSALAVTLFLALRNEREQALRRAAQAAWATEQERAVRAFQAAQEGHWEWNPGTQRSHLSPRMKELLGIPREQPLDEGPGLLQASTIHPDDRGPLVAAFTAHQAGSSRHFDATFRVRQGDGSWRHVRARGQVWRDAQGEPVLFNGTASDVTAELQTLAQTRQLEDQLQRARKLEALGTLAGGIAHDFNNILAAVIGYGELARAAAADGSGQARQLDQVLQAGQRGKALVGRILSFSRGRPGPQTAFLLAPVVSEVLDLLAASLPANVRLDRQLHATAAAVRGDATMVFEAAMNLCTNAMQAMPEGGTLAVELVELQLDEALPIFESRLPAGRYARLTVADSGAGITPEVMARLFEPFFTTKGPHHGTGLGLAVVHGVMLALGGAIDVQSAPGRGARFVLYFPSTEMPAGEALADDAGAASAGQGQTVLVVDDEPALVEMAEELLAGLGYEPVGFVSSQQALAAFEAQPDRFDLVITDEVMPGLTGTALAAALHRLRPGLPVLLASGYGGPQLEARAAAAGVTVLVKKPLARSELARAVQQALAAARYG